MPGDYEPLGPALQRTSALSFNRWRLGFICILAVLASSLVHWQWQTPASLLLLHSRGKPDSLALEILDANPRSTTDGNGWQSYNLTVCAIAAWEDDYLDEWLTYHRLLGVQHFYLYDHKKSPSTTKLLLPYIERGMVTLHGPPDEAEGQKDHKGFHGRLLGHCERNYGNTTKWLFHFDVDEFLQFSQVYPLASQPKRLDAGQYQFPLHDYLMQPDLSASRCLFMTRNGGFINVGLVDNPPSAVLDSVYYRTAASLSRGAAKVAVRGTAGGLAGKFSGAHNCVPAYDQSFTGVADPSKGLRNVQGGVETKQNPNDGLDTLLREPLMVAHFGQRSLQDCLFKLEHLDNADNWRVSNGGQAMCYRDFVPTPSQLEQKVFEGSEHLTEIMQRPHKVLVLDESIKNSWYGQNAIAFHAGLQGGRRPSLVDEAAALSAIVTMQY